MSVGSSFRRLYLRNNTFIGTSPAGTSCWKTQRAALWPATRPLRFKLSALPDADLDGSLHAGRSLLWCSFGAAGLQLYVLEHLPTRGAWASDSLL